MNYRFHPEARFGLRVDALFYESQRDGLGLEFRDALRDAIGKILEAPLRWALYEVGTRRCVIQRFPYVIIYLVEGDTVFIVAVMHCARKPGYWHERLEGES